MTGREQYAQGEASGAQARQTARRRRFRLETG